jgi:hypothetical protein
MTGDLAVELDRVVDRLRSMPLTKLSAPWPPYPSRAAGARALAQRLADAAADVSGEPRRVVPDVGDSAVGDQVAVTGADLLAAHPPAEVLSAAGDALRDFRQHA